MDWDWPTIIFVSTGTGTGNVWHSVLPTLLGAIVGGGIVFLVDFYFRRSDRKELFVERNRELYLTLNGVVQDVYAFGSRHLTALAQHGWPIEPWRVMKPALGTTTADFSMPAHLLMTIRGPKCGGLTQRIL